MQQISNMRLTQDSEQAVQQIIKPEDVSSRDNVAPKYKNNGIKEGLALGSMDIKEHEMDSAAVLNSSQLIATNIKVENTLASKQDLPKATSITITEFDVTLNGIKKEDAEIKVEKDFDLKGISNISKCENYATLHKINHISVGEVKIEDGICSMANTAFEEEYFDNEMQKAGKDCIDIALKCNAKSTCAEIKYENKDSDDVDMSSEEDCSSAVSNWHDGDEIPTTSRKNKNEKTNFPAEKEKIFKIMDETNNETDKYDIDMPSDNEEFLSDNSGGEEFLSEGDEDNSDIQNLSVDNKAIVSELIDEYHKRPQLWFKELSTEMSDVKKLQLFRSINNVLSKKFSMKFNVNVIKNLLNTLRAKYEAEIERQLNENEETTAESSNLWFYNKLFFLKDDIENNIKLKLEKTLTVMTSELAFINEKKVNRLNKKRESSNLRTQKLRQDPAAYALYLQKAKEKYLKRRKEGKLKLIDELTVEEKEKRREKKRIYTQKVFEQRKELAKYDPEEHKRLIEKKRESSRLYIQKIKQDPAANELYLQKARDRMERRRKQIKELKT